jgi:hypothetical protein
MRPTRITQDLQLTGETNVGHTATDEKVTLELGTAFDLAAERKTIRDQRVSDREREFSVEIRLRNRKTVACRTIVVEEPTPGDVEVLKSTHPAQRDEANLLRFTVAVPAGQEVVVGYTARQRW